MARTEGQSDKTSTAGTAATPAVSVRNLRMGYGTRVLLDAASFDVARGEIMVILGGSGCGKSSLMKNIIGLYQPMAGDILIDGRSIVKSRGDEKARLQRKLGIMYQSGALFGSLNVLENVRFPLDQFTDLAREQEPYRAHAAASASRWATPNRSCPGSSPGHVEARRDRARDGSRVRHPDAR